MYIEIKTDRLLLRPFTLNDAETVHTYASDEETTKYMLFLPNETMEVTRQFLIDAEKEWQKDTPSFYEFAIVLDGLHIGGISIYLDESKTQAELGWSLNKKYWGKGYGTEAAKAILDFAVNQLKVSKVKACCDARNKASFNVMQKIGLTLEDNCGTRTYPKTLETAKELICSANFD